MCTLKLFILKKRFTIEFHFFKFSISGGNICSNKKKHLTFTTITVSVLFACYTAITGLFLIFYFGLHHYVTKNKPIAAVFWTTVVG